MDLVDRIDVVPDPSLALLDATIEIETMSGTHLRSTRDGTAVSYTWSWTEIASWARALGAEYGRPCGEAIERVIDAVAGIEDAATVSVLAAATIVRR
jgi:hypothetical protein